MNKDDEVDRSQDDAPSPFISLDQTPIQSLERVEELSPESKDMPNVSFSKEFSPTRILNSARKEIKRQVSN